MMLVAGYQDIACLYESATSTVYRARRKSDRQPVILKMLRADYPAPEVVARFIREYELTLSLADVDGVIQVYALEPYQHTFVIVLEDFGGEALTRLLPSRPLPVVALLRLAIRITDILDRIHQRRIIHKDINPSNLVWNPEIDQIKIIDFGIASELAREQPEISNPTVLEGTLAYMSPEQTGRMNRALDYRTDLYSLGATFYHLLTGHAPFQTDDALEMVHCHLAHMPVSPYQIIHNLQLTIDNSQLSILSDITLKLMAKNAEDRYQSAVGVKADLEYCLAQLQVPGAFASFELGQSDLSDRFQIPEKLYGREPDIAALLAAFDRVADPQSQISHLTSHIEILLVMGYAGIGKTALVHEIHKPITAKRGYFMAGKFDQFTRHTPYSAIIQAFQGLFRQLLSEPAAQLARWKECLLKTVGPNGQVLVDVIPDLELLIGPQPAAADLPPAQAQNRFNFVFQNFVRTFAAPEHPLVIFLDDLQWADASSLGLLGLLSADPDMNALLIIGAYRDQEVSDAHPLMLTLRELQQGGAIVNTITLKPLTLEQVTRLLADTLKLQTEVCTPLAELVIQKTDGNPFFVRQFLHALHDEQLIEFDANRRAWTWNLEKIRQQAMTDNVVELMAGKIQKLSPATQQVLQLAACIGNQFDLQTLAIVGKRTPQDAMHDVWDALQTGLIVPLDDAYKYVQLTDDLPASSNQQPASSIQYPAASFRFLHDRIQQAAYALIADEQKKAVHLQIGQLLLANTPDADRAEKIFAIVNHLNLAQNLIIEQSARDQLAELNLRAGQKAKASAAYQPAYRYLKVGIDLLSAESWQQQYDLALALYTETAEAAYLNGEFAQTEQLVEMVLQRAKTLLDKVKVYEVKIEAYKAQNRLPEALRTGLTVLKLLGITFPEKPNKFHILGGLLRTKLLLVGKSIEDLINLPDMTDPYKLAAMRIAGRIVSQPILPFPNCYPCLRSKCCNYRSNMVIFLYLPFIMPVMDLFSVLWETLMSVIGLADSV